MKTIQLFFLVSLFISTFALVQAEESKKRPDEKIEALKSACASDVEKFCQVEEKKKGGPMACLKKNIEKLSSDCKASVSEMPEPPAEKTNAGKIMDL